MLISLDSTILRSHQLALDVRQRRKEVVRLSAGGGGEPSWSRSSSARRAATEQTASNSHVEAVALRCYLGKV